MAPYPHDPDGTSDETPPQHPNCRSSSASVSRVLLYYGGPFDGTCLRTAIPKFPDSIAVPRHAVKLGAIERRTAMPVYWSVRREMFDDIEGDYRLLVTPSGLAYVWRQRAA